MDLEYIEDKIDVFIESKIKENRLRRKLNYGKEILSKRNADDRSVSLVYNNKHQVK